MPQASADGARAPVILFAHGAGAPSTSEWMRRWADRLGALGSVVSFDYPYMKAGRKMPDRQPALVAAHQEALAAAVREHPGRPVVLAGKSMGSRMGCHLAVDLAAAPVAGLPRIEGLVCFGYPLRGINGALRDAVLRALSTPVLFLQGSRDELCPLPELEGVRAEMQAPSQLFVVEGGDHSLEVRKRAAAAAGRTQADWDRDLLATTAKFFGGLGLQGGGGGGGSASV